MYQPDIPQNTGTILRLAACVGVPTHVIGPAGFDLSDRALKRAGLDYLDHIELTRHSSWEAFLMWLREAEARRLILASTKASTPHHAFAYQPDDVLLFGRETSGVPAAVHAEADAAIRIPLQADRRSLNLAVACAMVLDQMLTATDRWPG